jgi:hypothetical protein
MRLAHQPLKNMNTMTKYSKNKDMSLRKKSRSTHSADAVFLGYQMTEKGKSIPLFNIIAKDHPLKGSTVSEESLRALKLRIPKIPDKKNDLKNNA